MIGFLVTGHDSFASGILSSAQMIMGKQTNVEIVEFKPQDDIEDLDRKIEESIKKLDVSDGLIIFSDIVGGSPFNRSMTALVQNSDINIHVISGTNLPLLIEAFNTRRFESDIKKVVDSIMGVSAMTILYGNKMLQDEMNS